MIFYQRAVHEQHIEYTTVIVVFHNAPVVQHRLRLAVFRHKAEAHIVVAVAVVRVNLLPNALFHRFIFVRVHEVAEPVIRVFHKFVQIITPRKAHKLRIRE